MRIEQEVEFQVSYDLTLDDLVRIKEEGVVPGDAKVDVRISKGDRPFESDVKYIKLSWVKEV